QPDGHQKDQYDPQLINSHDRREYRGLRTEKRRSPDGVTGWRFRVCDGSSIDEPVQLLERPQRRHRSQGLAGAWAGLSEPRRERLGQHADPRTDGYRDGGDDHRAQRQWFARHRIYFERLALSLPFSRLLLLNLLLVA